MLKVSIINMLRNSAINILKRVKYFQTTHFCRYSKTTTFTAANQCKLMTNIKYLLALASQ